MVWTLDDVLCFGAGTEKKKKRVSKRKEDKHRN